jgi:hypothetical protein
VSYTFRMEALAKALGEICLLSGQAQQGLGPHLEAKPVGSHALPGMEGSHPMFRL